MILIITFAMSLFIALILITIKAVELKFEKVNILFKLIGKLDSLTIKAIQSFRFRIYQTIQTTRFLIKVKTKEMLVDLASRSKEWVLNEYRVREGRILGQKEILNKGSVSFYLKKITDDRGNPNKGRIE